MLTMERITFQPEIFLNRKLHLETRDCLKTVLLRKCWGGGGALGSDKWRKVPGDLARRPITTHRQRFD